MKDITARPRRHLFAAGRITPKNTTAPVTHLSAHLDTAGLRISSTMVPQIDAGAFLVEMEAAAMRYEMQRAIREAA